MSKKTKTQHTWQATQAGKSMMAIKYTVTLQIYALGLYSLVGLQMAGGGRAYIRTTFGVSNVYCTAKLYGD
jgi:hypothetical protein